METLSALLAFFLHNKGTVMWSVDVAYVVIPNKFLNEQSSPVDNHMRLHDGLVAPPD